MSCLGYPSRLGALAIHLLLCLIPAGAQNGHSELKELKDIERQTIHNRKYILLTSRKPSLQKS